MLQRVSLKSERVHQKGTFIAAAAVRGAALRLGLGGRRRAVLGRAAEVRRSARAAGSAGLQYKASHCVAPSALAHRVLSAAPRAPVTCRTAATRRSRLLHKPGWRRRLADAGRRAADSWACTTVVVTDRRASRAHLVAHVMPRRAGARSRARALARAHVCTTLKLSTTRSVKFTVKSITHVVELTQSTLRKRKLDNNTVKLTSRQVDGPSDSQLDSVIRYSELDGRQLDYETRQLDLAGRPGHKHATAWRHQD